MDTLGKIISKLRKQKGLSQEMFAIDLNISQSSVSNYESGITKPDVDTLQKLAEYFKVPVGYFFTDENPIFYMNKQNESNNGNFFNSNFIILSEKLIELYEKKIINLEEEMRKLKEK